MKDSHAGALSEAANERSLREHIVPRFLTGAATYVKVVS
jgi:hypothetical protein